MLFNCILDGFPTEYKGYAINTDFKIGILLSTLMEDEEVEQDIKILQALNLLYKEEVPKDVSVAVDGIIWFLSCGKSEIFFEGDYKEDSPSERCLDFNVDHLDIWGAFWGKGVDLTTEKMHWFAFMSAICNLGDCPLTQKMSYRAADLSKFKGDTRRYYLELKEKFKIRKVITKEEFEAANKSIAEQNGSYYTMLRNATLGRL